MTNDTVLSERLPGGVLVLRLNRPKAYNAWTSAMRDRLGALMDEGAEDPEVRALVFTGTGDKAFCAGQDLAETERFVSGENVAAWLDNLRRFYDRVRALPKPIVGALNGLAAGSGFQIAIMLDVLVAHPRVRMGQPEVNSGIPSIFGPFLMNERLGRARTAELAVTGRLMEAEECRAIGLIHHLVPREEVLAKAIAVATDLARRPPHAMRLTKEFLRRADQEAYDQAWAFAAEGQAAAFATGEPQATMRAFFEERRRRTAARAG